MSAHHQQLNPLSHPHHHQRYASVGGGPPLTMTITSPVISPTTTSGIGAQRQTTFAPTLPLNIPNILESSRKYYVPELRDSVEVIKQPRTIPSSTNGVQVGMNEK